MAGEPRIFEVVEKPLPQKGMARTFGSWRLSAAVCSAAGPRQGARSPMGASRCIASNTHEQAHSDRRPDSARTARILTLPNPIGTTRGASVRKRAPAELGLPAAFQHTSGLSQHDKALPASRWIASLAQANR